MEDVNKEIENFYYLLLRFLFFKSMCHIVVGEALAPEFYNYDVLNVWRTLDDQFVARTGSVLRLPFLGGAIGAVIELL